MFLLTLMLLADILPIELNIFLFFNKLFTTKNKLLIFSTNFLICSFFLWASRLQENIFFINQYQYEILTTMIFLGIGLLSTTTPREFCPLVLFFLIENILVQELVNFIIAPITKIHGLMINFVVQLIFTLIIKKELVRLLPKLFNTKLKWMITTYLLLLFEISLIVGMKKGGNLYINTGKKIDAPYQTSINVNVNLSLIFLVFMGFIILVFAYTQHENQKILKYKEIAKEKEMLENYVSALESLQVSIQKVQHDYKNLLTGIDGFLNERHIDIEGLKEYLVQNNIIYNSVQIKDRTIEQLQKINLPAVKGLVTTKVIKALQEKINVTIECSQDVSIEDIDPFNLVKCLGIILDNAIEECRKKSLSEIHIGFIDNDNQTLIIVTNTCTNVKPELIIGNSSKGKNRGFGLQNLHEFINQCDNLSLSTTCNNGIFVQKLYIKKSF